MPLRTEPPIPSWLDAPLDDLPGHLDAALSQGLRPAEVWAWSCLLLAAPSAVPLDSFHLHAPLEVMARWRLMPLIPAADQALALLQMLVTAILAHRARPVADWPIAVPGAATFDALAQALDKGDVAATAHIAHGLLHDASHQRLPTPELCWRLADIVIDRLGASGHVPIGLQLLGHLQAQCPADADLARPMLLPLLVDLARTPERRVVWPAAATDGTMPAPEHPHLAVTSGSCRPDALISQLAALQRVPHPATAGIWPMVQQTLADGAHQPWLPAVQADPRAALADACRVAAWSMLQEPPDEARYGWTHALTLPQAWWALAPDVDVRETPGRTTQGQVPSAWPQARLGVLHVAAMRRVIGSLPLSAQVLLSEKAPSFATLAREASIRADAHGVKYVLACMDAALASPSDALLYRTAASRLTANWQASCPEAQILNTLGQR